MRFDDQRVIDTQEYIYFNGLETIEYVQGVFQRVKAETFDKKAFFIENVYM